LEKKQAAAPVPAEAALVPAPPLPLPRESSILSNETGKPAIASGAGAPTLRTPLTAATPEPLIASPPPLAPPAQNQPLEGIAASSPDTASASGTPARLHVSELPQSHVIYPVVSNPNLVGNVDLRAVIGADGTVKGVTVLSGNPKLVEAGIQAVRQWRYSPYEVVGHPVEVETNIKISFLGVDAVSISSPSAAAADDK
jgi:outer membrane biosynthesis protein TonB